IKDIAYKNGVGADLAEGVKAMSKKYGGEDFAPHAKGLEMAAYEPRGAVGHGLGYATANRGACHLDGGYLIYFEATGPVLLNPTHWRSKAGWAILDQNLLSAISAGGNCLFTSWTFIPGPAYKVPNSKILSAVISKVLTYAWASIDGLLMIPPALMAIHLPMLPHSKALKFATGMDMTFGKFLEVGDRGFNMERLFNLREGLTGKDDTLPKRFTDVPQIPGKDAMRVRLDKMMPKYYKLRGWDKNGVPTAKRMKRLGMSDIA
ncbi:MAG: aldehyde ferredoxin oxidoreductase C-terminal domain-containing protein, partial [Smithellaceae bacterium]|nr:aldehyde ferredoxin oxidoreductase C-terminal domain-containing protein [Smithellaceae bacterium]